MKQVKQFFLEGENPTLSITMLKEDLKTMPLHQFLLKFVKIGHLNVNSLGNKTKAVEELI